MRSSHGDVVRAGTSHSIYRRDDCNCRGRARAANTYHLQQESTT